MAGDRGWQPAGGDRRRRATAPRRRVSGGTRWCAASEDGRHADQWEGRPGARRRGRRRGSGAGTRREDHRAVSVAGAGGASPTATPGPVAQAAMIASGSRPARRPRLARPSPGAPSDRPRARARRTREEPTDEGEAPDQGASLRSTARVALARCSVGSARPRSRRRARSPTPSKRRAGTVSARGWRRPPWCRSRSSGWRARRAGRRRRCCSDRARHRRRRRGHRRRPRHPRS